MARDDVQLDWRGQEHRLKAAKVFRTARKLEPIITVTEIALLTQRGAIPYAAVAEGYAVALKEANVTGVEVEDVHDWLFEGEGEGQAVFRAMEKLAQILVPPSARQVLERAGSSPGGAAGEDGPPANPTNRARASSRAPSS